MTCHRTFIQRKNGLMIDIGNITKGKIERF